MKDSYFKGVHETCYGDKWSALLGNSEVILDEIAPSTIQQSHALSVDKHEDISYMIQLYTETSPISIVYISEIKEAEKKLSLVSAYPLLSGKKNRVILKDTYAWEIESEGEMAGELVDVNSKFIINFHNALFYKDINNFDINEVKIVSLAGLAYSLSKLDEYEFPLDSGNLYEQLLEEFLNKNPDKTEADFEKPVVQVTAEALRVFNPTEYTCEYDAIGQIKDIQYTTFFDNKVTIMCVEFAKSDIGQPFYCNVYATEEVLDGYKPCVGDGISTRMWLTGYFET